MVVLAFAVIPLLLIWWVLGLFMYKMHRLAAMAMLLLVLGLYAVCFVLGIVINFFYESGRYWDGVMSEMSFSLSQNLVDSVHGSTQDEGTNFYMMFLLPYTLALEAAWSSLKILMFHFSIGFAFSYSFFVWIMGQWIVNWRTAITLRDSKTLT